MQSLDEEGALFNINEAAMLANTCIASATSSTRGAYRLLVTNEKEILETVRGTTGGVVSAKSVAKEIDNRIIRARRKRGVARRCVGEAEVLYLAFTTFSRPLKLRPAAKAELYKNLVKWTAFRTGSPRRSSRSAAVDLARHIKFEPGDDLQKWLDLLDTYLTRRNDHIEINPEVMGGTPVVRGSRVPVYTVLRLVERGRSIDEVLKELPYLTREGVEAAVIYARSHPRTGRKKSFR
jgi:uncharacterized protein (DUF433 family)